MVPALVIPRRIPDIGAPFHAEPGFPDWPHLLAHESEAWTKARAEANGADILIATNTGMHGAVVTFDSMLAVALTLRGARVRFVLCDGGMQGCLMATHSRLPPVKLAERGLFDLLCKSCFNRGSNVLRALGLPIARFGDLLGANDFHEVENEVDSLSLDEIEAWRSGGAATGEHAIAGALRYFARGDLRGEPFGAEVSRRYAEGAALASRAYGRIVANSRPDIALLHHGIYSPQGIAADVLRTAGSRIVTWVVAYRKNCFIFSHNDTYHHTLISESRESWEHLLLSPAQEHDIQTYLNSRATGGRDWIYFHSEAGRSFSEYAAARGIDLDKPLVTALTNVMWDAQLHYPMNIFAGMTDWLVQTVQWFAERPALQLLVRVHPAEARGAIVSRQRVADELSAAFPILPSNVFVAGPEDEVSTYAACAASDAAIIYGTKMGVELAAQGVHCIVAGEAWIRGKGLTHDAQSKPHYFEMLAQLPFGETVPRPNRERALRYAYHFFFRRMMPLPFLAPNGTAAMFSLEIKTLDDLRPGRYPGLDAICEGILENAPFIYPAEVFGVHDIASR